MKWQLILMAFLNVLTAQAKETTSYFSGEVHTFDKTLNIELIQPVLYKRVIDNKNKKLIETCDVIVDGKHMRDTFEFDHSNGKLFIKDNKGRVYGEGKFKCAGQFPRISSCEYDYETETHKVKGIDRYSIRKAITFNSSVISKQGEKNGQKEVRGTIPKVSLAEYTKNLSRMRTGRDSK